MPETQTTPTPGPWKIERDRLGLGTVVGADGFEIMTVCDDPEVVEQDEANLRLIAAAPELYEAATYALEQYLKPGWENHEQVILKLATAVNKLRTSIAKAEGRHD